MKACIFDLDGTLLDSLSVWHQIDIDFLSRRGLVVPDDFSENVAALTFAQAAEYTIQRFQLPDTVDDVLREWNQMAKEAYAKTVPIKPYAYEYLCLLKKKGIKLGTATSLPSHLSKPALVNNNIFHLFDIFCCTEEVSNNKSQPDVFLLASRRLGVPPENCYVFEDVPEAIQSARSAGMQTIGVYNKESENQWHQVQKHAHHVLYSYKDAPLPFGKTTT